MSHEPFPTDAPAVVTCGLPYANGDLHVGHLRTYISGDVFARALESLGQRTAFVCGSDMHGTPIAVNAAEEGVDPEAFALRWHETYESLWPRFDVEFDNYGHTHDETNTALTLEIVESLIEQDLVYEKPIKVAWDPIEEQPLPDRYVEGTCPYCGEKARGDECDEGCQRHLEPGEIEEPRSTLTGNPAEYREREHKFFRVSEFAEYLEGFLDRLEGTANARNQPRQWLESGLQDWCITRDLDWGIDYPGEEDLVLYVWVDAPVEYISSTKQYTERAGADTFDWERAWREDGEVVHVIGRDIIQHHTVFWPAMLHATGHVEPRAVVASGFVNLEGRAFSTSRNRAVWAEDYLDAGFEPDLLRWYIATQGNFQQDVDFTWDRFQERVNAELADDVGNFVYRSLLFAHREFGGTPETAVEDAVAVRIDEAIDDFGTAVNAYSLRRAGQAALELARFGNEYIQQNEPWALVDEDRGRAATVIRGCVQLAKATAVLLAPFTPRLAQGVWADLGEDGSVHDADLADCRAAPPTEFGEPHEPVEKIPDERVEALNEQLQAQVEGATDGDADDQAASGGDGGDEAAAATASGDGAADLEAVAQERVSFEEFQALDLRVGRVEVAEPVEDADELVRLEVDLGVERRQVVAGLAQLHDVDDLPGTRVVVAANLEPTELFGLESDGMVLAAGEQADLLTTHGDARPGTRVR